MMDLKNSGKLAKTPALLVAVSLLAALASCGPPGLLFSDGSGATATTTTDTTGDASISSTVIEVEFAEDGSILGPEVLLTADGEFESEVTFNDQEEEALEEARSELARAGKWRHLREAKSSRAPASSQRKLKPAHSRENPRKLKAAHSRENTRKLKTAHSRENIRKAQARSRSHLRR